MRLKSKLGPKGQVVIPKEIRETLKIGPGDEVFFELRGEEVVVRPKRRGSIIAEFAELAPKKSKLREEVDIKAIILSEAAERRSI